MFRNKTYKSKYYNLFDITFNIIIKKRLKDSNSNKSDSEKSQTIWLDFEYSSTITDLLRIKFKNKK